MKTETELLHISAVIGLAPWPSVTHRVYGGRVGGGGGP